MRLPELMTLTVLFQQLCFIHFKGFYLGYAYRHFRAEFPGLTSYQRAVELMPRSAASFTALFECVRGQCDGASPLTMPHLSLSATTITSGLFCKRHALADSTQQPTCP